MKTINEKVEIKPKTGELITEKVEYSLDSNGLITEAEAPKQKKKEQK
jgi:hypothetical protein